MSYNLVVMIFHFVREDIWPSQILRPYISSPPEGAGSPSAWLPNALRTARFPYTIPNTKQVVIRRRAATDAMKRNGHRF